MLMFVGEDLEILSLASRRQESAWQAPAVARVIPRKTFREQGAGTLGQALSRVPGFYMAKKEWGTQPYLRGVPNSVLFLYDTVPLGSDLSKLIHPLDEDLSLAAVKRIEIVSGPGSVLWGPDAFAGIVNVVPLSGRDVRGAETGVLYGAPGDRTGAWMNVGHDRGPWDALLSVSVQNGEEDDTLCNVVRFWRDDRTAFSPEERYGIAFPDKNHYLDVLGRLAYENRFSLTGRVAESRTSYAMTDEAGDLSWKERRRTPSGFVKLEAKQPVDHLSAFRFTGFYSYVSPEFEIIDYALDQKERTTYAEAIYDRSFPSGRGMLTAGASFRDKQIRNAPAWDGYLTEYLGPDNENLTPVVYEEDYTARLWSVFGQYRRKIRDVEIWFGARFDDHDAYQDHISVSAGGAWSPDPAWMIKLLGGTAYRTPFSRQLLESDVPDLEKIRTGSLSAAWKPTADFSAEICGFVSRIDNHIVEDLYYGLSEPNAQDIHGAELEMSWRPVREIALTSNLTVMDNNGPDELYYYNDYSFLLPDGTVERHYQDMAYPYDLGADALFNFGGVWTPHEYMTFSLNIRYMSAAKLIYPLTSQVIESDSGWLADMTAVFENVGAPGFDIQVCLKNLTDRTLRTPGSYSMIEVDPFYAEIRCVKTW